MASPTSVAAFLIARIKELGVDHVFGIPGDYVLPFFDELIKPGSPVQHVGTTNELTAAYLADGYSRIRGLGVVAVTYGPGAFNAINAVAGANEANVPLLILSGAPKTSRHGQGKLLHHAVGCDLDATLRVFEPFTAAVARINSADEAAPRIDCLLRTALDTKRPVYLEIPYDMQKSEVLAASPLNYLPPRSDPEALSRAVEQIAEAVNGAKSVGALVGVFVDRNSLQDVAEAMLASSNLPFATTFDQKAGYLEHLPNCVGFWQGATSSEPVLDAVERSEVLLSIGMPQTEFNTGFFTGELDEARTIELGHDHVNLTGDLLPGVYLWELLPKLAERLLVRGGQPSEDSFVFTYTKPLSVDEERPLTVDAMYQQLAHYVQEGDIVTGNTGGYINMSRMRLKRGVETAGPSNWASLGSVFPVSIGMAFASPSRRVICLDGDGSFQMTGMELSTLLRHNMDFLLIILNNTGYTAERAIHPEREDSYNDIQVWNYHLLPEALGGPAGSNGSEILTEGQLSEALNAYKPGWGPRVLNARLGKLDLAAFNLEMSAALRH
mmetsp:Transcript_85149/g.237661  ORF Transcript_85149/g.237661 Transcript_85149/m.237661 type:complete len:552 (+) Transcript_85149:79-1734(+)